MLPVLHTERLLLRALEPRDDARFWRLRCDPVVHQWLEREPWPTVDRAREERLKLQAGMDAGKWYFWALSEGAARPLVGTICLWNFTATRDDCEVGFELLVSHQRKGLMSEALRSVLSWAWSSLPLRSVSALTHQDNAPARALLAHSGFVEAPVPLDWELTDVERDTHVLLRAARPMPTTSPP